MSSFKELKETAWKANMGLADSGLVIATFGNVSQYDKERGVYAIKPSGVPYPELTADMMTVVDLDNKVVEGTLRPSSDTKTHTVLYRSFPEIGGISHTHSTYAVAWAQAMKPVPILGTTHADHLADDIPCTRPMSDEMIKGDYETETGNQIVQHFADLSYKDIGMVLVACHGPFTWGDNADKALYNSIILEELCKMAYLSCQINPGVQRLYDALINKHYQRKHGANAYYGQK
ncbi:MAG: L-ribulose-5-phosphate 4-epimerase AraD [Chitinispirillaceae bacterium]|nr:L-ribulose-5-phosphate 4-epimerase AraD [Chitinispirillaceae bacterium]